MTPQKLILTGFIGIAKGLGLPELTLDLTTLPASAQLVALVGENGRGKTTVLDNLHPYLVMPSRSTTLGSGGFSYYRHIAGPTASKILEWAHGGVNYRTVLHFKKTPKTEKTEAFLYILDAGNWRPATLPDGTVSDGKTAVYEQLISAILGDPKHFFTAQFAAQKRRPLADYAPGEIKSLLSSILDLSHLRELSTRAGAVANALRPHIDALADRVTHAMKAQTLAQETGLQRATTEQQLRDALAKRNQSKAKLDQLRADHARLLGQQQAQASDAQRGYLQSTLAATQSALAQALQAIADRAQQARSQLLVQETTLRTDIALMREQASTLQQRQNALVQLLAEAPQVEQACHALPQKQTELAKTQETLRIVLSTMAALSAVRTEFTIGSSNLAAITYDGKNAVAALVECTTLAALRDQTPCQGQDLQRRCPLMKKANQAFDSLAQKTSRVTHLKQQWASTSASLQTARSQLTELESQEALAQQLRQQQQALQQAILSLTTLAARQPALQAAKEQMATIIDQTPQHQEALQAKEQHIARLKQQGRQIDTVQNEEENAARTRCQREQDSIQRQLAQLPEPVQQAQVDTLATAIHTEEAAHEQYQYQADQLQHHHAFITNQHQTHCREAQLLAPLQAQQQALQDELAHWRCLETALGNNGLIAYSIDDAGPEIARLCNQLLHESADGRFTLRMDTQKHTASGTNKETFVLVVFDSRDGQETLLDYMSGGEGVWINECLIRAIALYAARANDKPCKTLFSDETDGPLDPERKRAFMRMKRQVLALGGYEREFFTSQTPELTSMADEQIVMASFMQ